MCSCNRVLTWLTYISRSSFKLSNQNRITFASRYELFLVLSEFNLVYLTLLMMMMFFFVGWHLIWDSVVCWYLHKREPCGSRERRRAALEEAGLKGELRDGHLWASGKWRRNKPRCSQKVCYDSVRRETAPWITISKREIALKSYWRRSLWQSWMRVGGIKSAETLITSSCPQFTWNRDEQIRNQIREWFIDFL